MDPSAILQPDTLARLELGAPAKDEFILHGTIPLPKEASIGTRPPALAVISRADARARIPAQVEVVSRYPTGEPDVVEVIARVSKSDKDRTGRLIGFDIVPDESVSAVLDQSGEEGQIKPTIDLPQPVQDFFKHGDAPHVLLRARDAYGQLYGAELTGEPDAAGHGSSHTLADGRWVRRIRTYATMVPIAEELEEGSEERLLAGPANGGPSLPHLFGVHAYWTQYSGDTRIGLDLRINNGACAGSHKADPLEETLGIVYFDALELVLPHGWFGKPLVKDPYLGKAFSERGYTVHPLVKRIPLPKKEGEEDDQQPAQVEDAKGKSRAGKTKETPANDKEAEDKGKEKQGPLHVMGPQAQMHRRWTLSPTDDERGHVALEGLAFAGKGDGLWSWYEPSTARFLTHRGMLARWDDYVRGSLRGRSGLAAELNSRLGALRQLIEKGAANGLDVIGRAMGWAHPWFVKTQGGTGGGGIQIYEGHMAAAAASGDGVERLMLYHRMNVSRQPQAMFDKAGDFVGFHQWMDESGVVPFDFRTNGGMVAPQFRLPCKGGPRPSPQVRFVHNKKLRPPYDQGDPHKPDGQVPMRDDNIWSWAPHDGQHMIRYTKFPKAIVWLANDPLAKDDLMVSGETFHLQFHEAGHSQVTWSPGVSLQVYEKQVAERPGEGANLGRDHAWGIDAMVAAYSVAPLEWRERHIDWFARVARLFTEAAMPSGVIMRNPNPKILGHDKYEAAQTYQSLFLLHAMRGMNEAVFREVRPSNNRQLENLFIRTLEYLYWGPVFEQIPLKEQYQPKDGKRILTRGGPREAFAVGMPDAGRTPPFSEEAYWGTAHLPEDGFGGGVEDFHCWSALEYGYLISKEKRGVGVQNRYLKRVLACWTQPRNHALLLEELFGQTARPSSDNSGNWVGLAGRLQALKMKR